MKAKRPEASAKSSKPKNEKKTKVSKVASPACPVEKRPRAPVQQIEVLSVAGLVLMNFLDGEGMVLFPVAVDLNDARALHGALGEIIAQMDAARRAS